MTAMNHAARCTLLPWRTFVLAAALWTMSGGPALAQTAAGPPGMNPMLRDVLQSLCWLLLSVGGVVAAWRAADELRANREIRARKLRWQQAEQARVLLDDLFQDARAADATLMTEWDGRTYEVE